jgi:hypothetical protein
MRIAIAAAAFARSAEFTGLAAPDTTTTPRAGAPAGGVTTTLEVDTTTGFADEAETKALGATRIWESV